MFDPDFDLSKIDEVASLLRIPKDYIDRPAESGVARMARRDIGARKPLGSIAAALAELRAAGGDAWDKVEDVEEFLGRKDEAPETPTAHSFE
jgi:hypothetical protein